MSLPVETSPELAQVPFVENLLTEMSGTLGQQLPNLLWAIAILIIGWLVATIAATIVSGLLNRTSIDNRLASMVLGENSDQKLPVEQWIAAIVYWIIMIFAVVAFLQALQLDVVSEPLQGFLDVIFEYLPRVGSAAILLGVAWAVATIVKFLLTQGLSRFNLDDRLSQQMGGTGGDSPFLLNETIGNILYWFIFLLFIPLILDALNLPGLQAPITDLIDQFLQAIPSILTAGIIFAIGWFVARIVRDVVVNLLRATQVDQIGSRFGFADSTVPGDDAAQSGISLSNLLGTIVYVLILVPISITALEELDIEAISGPAVSMLERVLSVVPQVLMAGIVLVVFYLIGRFVSELVTSILRSLGFDNILSILGLPELSTPRDPVTPTPVAGAPTTSTMPPGTPGIPTTSTTSPTVSTSTPSEFVGLVTLVGIVLFGAVTATEILQFETLTTIVQAILRIAAQVLSGVLVFGVGLYLANLAFRLIRNMGGSNSNFLAQAARVAIIILVGAMGLQQMGVATDIVNLAFGLLLGAVAVAIAIAFGMGGRDIASEQIREWLNAFKNQ
ncbi:MAG: mechanosensitive ion channel [Cyanobacteria bacterium J06638_28]